MPTATLIASPDKSMGIPYTGMFTVPESVEYNGVTYTVTSIGEKAFENRIGLTEVVIPNTVTMIGDEAFYGCLNLDKVTCNSPIPPTLGVNVFNKSSLKIDVPSGAEDAYKAAGWPI